MMDLALLALGFIVASGFFAMIDAAILNVTPAEVEVLISKKRLGAWELKILLRHITRAIIVIVMFTNVTNILGPILIGRKAEFLYGSEVIGIVTAVLTFLTIIFSEIIPKSIGAHYAPRISRRVAPVLLALIVVLYPIVIVLERFARVFKRSGKRKVGTEEQIRALANIGGGAGHIDADERELIHRAFVLNDKRTRDVMVPAASIISIPKTANIRRAAITVFQHKFSRFPVFGNSLDQVEGHVIDRDVLVELADGNDDFPITDVVRPIVFVQADTRCDELLNVLRKSPSQIAIVREGTVTVGLVSLEDVLEELIGKIEDKKV